MCQSLVSCFVLGLTFIFLSKNRFLCMEFAARESIPVSQIRPSPTSDDEYAVQQVGRLPVCFVALIARRGRV